MLPRSQLRKRTAPDVEKRGSQDAIGEPAAESSSLVKGGDADREAAVARGPGVSYGFSAVIGLAGLCAFVVVAQLRHLFLGSPSGEAAPTIRPDSRTQPPSALALAQVSEILYQRGKEKRGLALAQSGGISGIDPFDQEHGVYIWDWFTPDWNCPDKERVGPIGDGGYWTCGIDALKRTDGSRCLMYTYGVRDDSRFEMEVVRRVGCEVHAFDPTIGGLPPDAAEEPRIFYHKQAVGPKSGHDDNFLVAESILDTMARLGHTWLDILKIDVEASEWSVFEAMLTSGKLPFSQILVELHYADPAAAFDFFEGLERYDFRIFSRETNHQPCVAGRLPVAVVYSLVRSPLAPWPPAMSARVTPKQPQGANAAVWVMSHVGRLNQLVRTVKGLAAGLFVSWNLRGRYPLVVNVPADDMDTVRKALSPIAVEGGFEIKYHAVKVAKADWPTWEDSSNCGVPSAGPSYHAAELKVRTSLADEYEWLMRIGDDAQLAKPLGYDPFVMMAEVGKTYGVLRGIRWFDEQYPSKKCFEALTKAAVEFAAAQSLTPKRGLALGRPEKPKKARTSEEEKAARREEEHLLPLLLGDQLEVARSTLWRRGSAYADFHTALSGVAGSSLPRFGDAALQTMHAALFVPEEQWHVFEDVGMASRGGVPGFAAAALPPPMPRSPLEKGGVLYAGPDALGGNGTNGTRFNGTNGTNGTDGYARQKAAIYVLADGRRLGRLVEMLQSLDRHFNQRFHYPIVVFEEHLQPAQKARLSAATHSALTFVPVDFRLPAFMDADKVPEKTGCLPERGLGYRHMCRFQAGIVNMKLAEMGYEWHWRMDDDSLLTGDLRYDIFGFMASKGLRYGYVSTVKDDDACIVDLWDTAKTYSQRAGSALNETWFSEWPRGAVFYNNFEIAHASVFTSPAYRAYFDHIDQHGGIYTRRWGDAPIKSIAVSLFVPPEKVWRFGDVGYRHSPFIDQEPEYMRRVKAPARPVAPLHALAWKPEKPVQSIVGRFHVATRADADLQQLLAAKVSSEPGWIGGDVATSVRIAQGAGKGDADTYIWLFGDTLVGTIVREDSATLRRQKRDKQAGGHLVRNSIGTLKVDRRTRRPVSSMSWSWTPQAQEGAGDTAAISLLSASRGSSDFVWPLAALSYNAPGGADKLYLIASLCGSVRGTVAGLLQAETFSVKGSMAIVVHNPHDSPELWTYDMKRIPVPTYEGLLMWHVGIARADEQGLPDENGDWIYLLGAVGGWTKQVLARVPLADFATLNFDGMQVWSTKTPGAAPAWNAQSSLPKGDDFAKTLVTIGEIGMSTQESGLYYHKKLQQWYFPLIEDCKLYLRTASSLTGPWSTTLVYTIPERFSDKDRNYLPYAVKAHPELAGDDEIVLTYNVNTVNDPYMGRLWEAGEVDTYVPVFLRLDIKG